MRIQLNIEPSLFESTALQGNQKTPLTDPLDISSLRAGLCPSCSSLIQIPRWVLHKCLLNEGVVEQRGLGLAWEVPDEEWRICLSTITEEFVFNHLSRATFSVIMTDITSGFCNCPGVSNLNFIGWFWSHFFTPLSRFTNSRNSDGTY